MAAASTRRCARQIGQLLCHRRTGALIGLQFVIITLIAERPTERAAEAGAAFATQRCHWSSSRSPGHRSISSQPCGALLVLVEQRMRRSSLGACDAWDSLVYHVLSRGPRLERWFGEGCLRLPSWLVLGEQNFGSRFEALRSQRHSPLAGREGGTRAAALPMAPRCIRRRPIALILGQSRGALPASGASAQASMNSPCADRQPANLIR
jgi:hypothetical protein